MGWIIALSLIAGLCLLLFFILMLKVRLTVRYDEKTEVKLRILFIPFTLYPKKWKIKDHLPEKEKKKSARKAEKKKRKKEAEKPKAKQKKSFKETFHFYTELVKAVVTPVAQRIKKHLHVRVSRLEIELGSEDAAQTAIVYGAVVPAANVFLAFLEDHCVLEMGKKENIYIIPVFHAEETTFWAEITVSLRLWQAIHIALPALVGYLTLKQYSEEQSATVNTENQKKQ